jgi:hypothetical protein
MAPARALQMQFLPQPGGQLALLTRLAHLEELAAEEPAEAEYHVHSTGFSISYPLEANFELHALWA